MNQEIEVYKLQYQQALDTYRTQFTLLINILTIFIVANVTLIGFAVDKKNSLMLLTGAIFPLAIHFAYRTIKELMKPIILTALYLEKKMNIQNQNPLVFTFINYLTSDNNFISKLDEILNEENLEMRMRKTRQFRELGFSLTNKEASFFKVALFAIFLSQVILAFLFAKYYSWTFG